MGSSTPALALPYPTGTDRVMDGDNAIQALAERLELKLPRGELGRGVSVTPQLGIAAAPVDLAGLTVTVTLPAARRIRLSIHVVFQVVTSGSGLQIVTLNDGAAVVARTVHTGGATGSWNAHHTAAVLTPAAGAHTYKVQGSTTVGSLNTDAAPTTPAFLLVEDLGPV